MSIDEREHLRLQQTGSIRRYKVLEHLNKEVLQLLYQVKLWFAPALRLPKQLPQRPLTPVDLLGGHDAPRPAVDLPPAVGLFELAAVSLPHLLLLLAQRLLRRHHGLLLLLLEITRTIFKGIRVIQRL